MERTIENVKELIEKGMSTREMAKIFGITQTPMYLWMKARGLSTKYRSSKGIRTWTDDDLIDLAKKSTSKADLIRGLGLSSRSGNYDTINKYIKMLNIDISHFTGQAHGKTRSSIHNNDVFIKDSTFCRSGIKKRIIKDKLIAYKCSICSINEWNDSKLVLVLDHINGINNDHRIENLRFLCPNCNSQQDTFCRGSSVVVAED